MGVQMVFKRYELKYLITRQQKNHIILAMQPYMKIDKYGRTTIRNLYFDTDNYRLIRRSLEKPVYKEKLRIRSYKPVEQDDPVFVELKKKYQSVVYKRREVFTEQQCMDWLLKGGNMPKDNQICKEIDYFCKYYENLHPTVFLSYEREAFYSLDGSDFRVTFDENIQARTEELSLKSPVWGTSLLDDNLSLMEIKTSGGIPLWMTHLLTEQQIYKSSFSKYGTAYEKIITNSERSMRYA